MQVDEHEKSKKAGTDAEEPCLGAIKMSAPGEEGKTPVQKKLAEDKTSYELTRG